MSPKSRKSSLVVALVLFCSSAQAYVPPSFFTVRMLARKHAAFDDGRIKSKVTFYKKSGEISGTATETLIVSGENAAVRLSDSSGNELATRTRKLLGSKSGDLERPVAYDLLFIKDGANIYEHFKLLGLPLKTEAALYSDKEGTQAYKPEPHVALERFEGRVVVVVGDAQKNAPVPTSTSLWLEKDSFLPLRAVFPSSPESGMSSEPLDFRFSGFTVHKNFLYPRVMQVYRSGALWAKVEMQDIRSATALEQGVTKSDPDGDLRENLETYLKWIR